MENSKDLLVIGPGELGSRVATLWQKKYPNSKIALKANHHYPERTQKWRSLGFCEFNLEQKYPNILFAVPASGNFQMSKIQWCQLLLN